MSIELAKNIVNITKQQNIPIKTLEEKAGLYDGYLRKVRAGSITNINVAKLKKISLILNVTVDSLLGITTPKSDKNKILKFDAKLFDKVNKCILDHLKSYHISEFSLKVYDIATEIYSYSLENNNSKVDEKFAKFLLEKYLEQAN